MVRKRGLGQGLSALINNELEEENTIDKKAVTVLKLTMIEPNVSQPRKKFEEDRLQELAESIKQYGVIQPLVVMPKGKFYEIIVGERRWRAAKMAGLTEVPVLIKEISEEERVEVALIENIQRENLNPIEEAIAYKKLIDDFHLKQDEIADKVSKSRSAIANTMRLLQLDEHIHQMVIDEKLSGGHARALLGIKDKRKQYEVAQEVFDRELSVRETEKLIKKLSQELEKKPKEKKADPVILSVQKQLEERLGTKVTINAKKNKGKIEIDYYSPEELERLIDLLNQVK